MGELWAAIIGGIRKFGPTPLFALGGVGALLIFGPQSWLARFGVG
jgi:hypothetical protein